MNGENERSVASGGSVADEPVAWGVMRVGGRFEYASVCRELAVAMQSMFEQTENWKYEVAPLYANSTRAVRLPKLLEKMHGETEYGKGYNTAVRTCQEILATAGVEPVKS